MARASNQQRVTDPVEKLALILEKRELDHEATKSRAIGPNIVVENDSLRDWLAIATEGLCPQARIRIVSEIAGHFADSMANERQQGRSLEAAERAAMTALGNPKGARRKLRKANLTQRESRILSGITADLHNALRFLVFISLVVLSNSLIALLSNYLTTQPGDFPWQDYFWGMGLGAGYFLPTWLGPILLALDKHHSICFAARSIACVQGVILIALLIHVATRIALLLPISVDTLTESIASIGLKIIAFSTMAILLALVVAGYGIFAVWPAIRLAQKLPAVQGPVQS